jgi:hypothetical protein
MSTPHAPLTAHEIEEIRVDAAHHLARAAMLWAEASLRGTPSGAAAEAALVAGRVTPRWIITTRPALRIELWLDVSGGTAEPQLAAVADAGPALN